MGSSLGETLLQLAIFSMALAFYNLFFQEKFLALFGEHVGFGEVALGYFTVGLISLTITRIIVRTLKKRESDEA